LLLQFLSSILIYCIVFFSFVPIVLNSVVALESVRVASAVCYQYFCLTGQFFCSYCSLRLGIGTSCGLLHEPSAPMHRIVSNDHWTCFCFNEWASCCRWQQLRGTGLEGAIAKTITLTLLW